MAKYENLSMNNWTFDNLNGKFSIMKNNTHIEYINYIFVLPGISLFGFVTNLICIACFSQSILKGDLYKYLLLNSLFNLITYSVNLVYPITFLLKHWTMTGSKEEALYELYAKNFLLSVCLLNSILFMIYSLIDRYLELNQATCTQILTKLRFALSTLTIFLFSLICFSPILLAFRIDQVDELNHTKLNAFFTDTQNMFSLKQVHKNFNLNINITEKIYVLSPQTRGILDEDFYQDLMKILNFFLNVFLLIVPIVLIYLLAYTLRTITKKKRAEFFRSAENSTWYKMKYWKNLTFINAFDSDESKNQRFLIYRKSTCDIQRERLILMVISNNFLLILARIPNLIYLIIISLFDDDSTCILALFLSNQFFIYLVVFSDSFLFLTQSLFLFVYLKFDKQFRKAYERIFRHICYFKIHFPKFSTTRL